MTDQPSPSRFRRQNIERSFGTLLRSIGIRPRLITTFLAVSIIPVIAIALITSLSYSRGLNDQVANYSSQLVAQMAKNMAETFDRMVALTENLIVHPAVQTALKDRRNQDTQQKRQIYFDLDSSLARMIYRDGKVSDVNLFRTDNSLLFTTGYYVYHEKDQAGILDAISRSQQNMHWTIITNARGNHFIVVGRQIFDTLDTKRVIGSLAIMLDEHSFARNAFYGVDMGTDADLLLLARDGTVISSAGTADIVGTRLGDRNLSDQLARILDERPNSFSWTDGDGTSLVCATAIPLTDWVLMARIPNRVIERLSRQMVSNVILACLVIILMVSFVGSVLFFSIQTPLERLSKAARVIQQGDFGLRIGDRGSDEVGQVSRAMDEMAGRLGELVAEIRHRQEEKRRIELEVLQSQINPHFLFNTLDSLKWTAMLHGNQLVGEGIGALSSLLRNGVLAEGDSMSLEEEIRNLHSYALILRLRYGDSFRLEIAASPEALACHLPKLLLQPFVENAIIHGGRDEAGTLVTIELEAKVEGDSLVITIRDDGRGFDPERTPAGSRDRFSGIGINNVQERIRLWYGEPWGMTIASRPGAGTTAILRLPARPQADRN